jgi:hypothetical protein
MGLDEDGFLSDDIERIRQMNRRKHGEILNILRDINRLAHSVQPTFGRLKRTPKSFLTAAYFIRALQNVQGAIVMAERGMLTESYTLVRSGLETVFYLAGAIHGKDFGRLIGRDHVRRVKKATKDHLDWMESVEPGSTEASTLKAAMHSIDAQGIDPLNLQIKKVSEDAGLGELYKTLYQQLSMVHAHPNLPALNSIIENDKDQEPVGLRWGPERNDDGDMAYALCLSFNVYALILGEWLKFQPSTDTERRVEDLKQQYVRYYNALPDTDRKVLVGS